MKRSGDFENEPIWLFDFVEIHQLITAWFVHLLTTCIQYLATADAAAAAVACAPHNYNSFFWHARAHTFLPLILYQAEKVQTKKKEWKRSTTQQCTWSFQTVYYVSFYLLFALEIGPFDQMPYSFARILVLFFYIYCIDKCSRLWMFVLFSRNH